METIEQNAGEIPFLLARHGESVGNTSQLCQGRGEDASDILSDIFSDLAPHRLARNGLTARGVEQVGRSVIALQEAGLHPTHISCSELSRARDSSVLFAFEWQAKPRPHPRGVVGAGTEGIREVSQRGWEMRLSRDEARRLRLGRQIDGEAIIRDRGVPEELVAQMGWLTRFGTRGESPLGAALRGIAAIEEHGPKSGELIHSHGMLNRFMEAIANSTSRDDRASLNEQFVEHDVLTNNARWNILDDARFAAGTFALLDTLHEMGVHGFSTVENNPSNHQPNASATEITIRHADGRWLTGRRIEPTDAGSDQDFVALERDPETFEWSRI